MEKQLDQVASTMAEQELKKAIDQLEIDSEIPAEVKSAMLEDFKRYAESDDEIVSEVTKIQEEYKALLKENDAEFDQLMAEMNLKKLIERLTSLKELAVKIGNTKAASHYTNLLTELQSSLTLDVMFDSLGKIKNPSKSLTQAEMNMLNELRKLRSKLKSSRKYYFTDPIKIYDVLTNHVEERIAKIFTYSFARFVNSKGQNGVADYSIFINQIIKNIYALDTSEFADKQTLTDSINKYVQSLIFPDRKIG
jgi:hypothetical protein